MKVQSYQAVVQKTAKISKHLISSVVATGIINTDVLIYFNESLKNLSRANGVFFVNKVNISEGNLHKDWLHLLEAGKRIPANSFINCVNNYYFY